MGAHRLGAHVYHYRVKLDLTCAYVLYYFVLFVHKTNFGSLSFYLKDLKNLQLYNSEPSNLSYRDEM